MSSSSSISAPKIDESASSIGTLASSVPSVSVSGVNELHPMLLSRWETELHQLHQLGFLDDRRNIDALGTLEAANMGVDSVDPVTVEDVVEYLLKKI